MIFFFSYDCWSGIVFTYANSVTLPSMELLELHIRKLSDTAVCIYMKVLDIDLFLAGMPFWNRFYWKVIVSIATR